VGKFRNFELINIDGFELQKLGTLKKREEEWIEQYYADLQNATTKPALELAEWIVTNEGKTEAEAMLMIEGLETMRPSEQMAFLMVYKRHLPAIIQNLQDSPRRQKAIPKDIATWALNERLPKGWIAENRNELREDLGIDADGDRWLPEWTDELGEGTIDAIYRFILRERNGWMSVAAEFVPNEPEEEDQSLGEELPPSVTGSPPIGVNDGRQLHL
jgi:hypothetical protein